MTINKQRTQADRILGLLEQNDSVEIAVLARIAHNVPARISELRQRGYIIEQNDDGYRLGGLVDVEEKEVDHADRLRNYVKRTWKKLSSDEKDDFCEWLNAFVESDPSLGELLNV